jgi:Transcription elongation factor, GreA/GreB, C-term
MTLLDSIDKTRVLAALRTRLEQELHAAFEAQQRTREGATHEESRPENDKDTRALESSYLARGQAQRVLTLSTELTSLNGVELRRFGAGAGIALSALLALDDGERLAICFLASAGGGLELEVEGVAIQVVTPQSPLGRALLGQRAGDDIEVPTPRGLREYSIAELA